MRTTLRALAPPAFLSKLKQARENEAGVPRLMLPSVVSSVDLVTLVDGFRRKMTTLAGAPTLPSGSLAAFDWKGVADGLRPLCNESLIKEELVRLELLQADRRYQFAPLVPFRVARDLVLRHIPEPRAQETARAELVKYTEADLYAQPRLFRSGAKRSPAVCIMGHIDHGKTTLLDTLQASDIASHEAGNITQSIRAFTVGLQGAASYPTAMSFVDTPGHKLFAELRLTGQHAVDYVLLIVALDEGIKGQTEEVVLTALHLKKPVVVAFNKVDLFDDPHRLAHALTSATTRLRELGVAVRLVDTIESLDSITAVVGSGDFDRYCDGTPRHIIASSSSGGKVKGKKKRASSAVVSSDVAADTTTGGDGTPRGTPAEGKPQLFSLGVCISGKLNRNVTLLLECIRRIAAHRPPLGSPDAAPTQAVIIESFKHDKHVIISCLVRNGTLIPGMHFVADHAHGKVTHLTDQFGVKLLRTLPGCVCNVQGTVTEGCPAPGTHVVEVASATEAARIAAFRSMLQKYLEKYNKHAHLLRPEGMDCRFMHVGNFGQVDDKESYDYNLLFRTPVAEPAKSTGVEERWIASQLPNEDQPKTEEAAVELLKATKPFAVLLKADSWHSVRLLTREIPRLGTRDVSFHVLAASFGAITESEVNNLHMIDIVLSFRGPPLTCGRTGFALEVRKIVYKECSVYTDVIEFFKQFAVDEQRKITLAKDAKLLRTKEQGDALLQSCGIDVVRAKRSHGRQKLAATAADRQLDD